jgi:predicted enzyme related to lactoylglutathione lyase
MAEKGQDTAEAAKPAAFQHLSIPAADLAAAQAFYGNVFGWTFMPHRDDYVLFDDGGYGGGLTSEQHPGVDGVLPYLLVADIPATLAKVTAAGGKVLINETPAGDSGGFAVFTDPHGNRIGLYSPGD